MRISYSLNENLYNKYSQLSNNYNEILQNITQTKIFIPLNYVYQIAMSDDLKYLASEPNEPIVVHNLELMYSKTIDRVLALL